MSYLSEDDIEAIQHLHKKTPYLFRDVKDGQLSIGRHYGGITFQGEYYIYLLQTDELIRLDVFKLVNSRKAETLRDIDRAIKAAVKARQPELF